MTMENEILTTLKNSVREELNREANATIDKLCHKFRCELGKHKNELVTEILNRIDIEMKNHCGDNDVVFQITIKGGMNNAE